MKTLDREAKEEIRGTVQMVSFQVGTEEYAVDIAHVQELTTVPRTASFLKGVINLRGKIIPIIHLATRLNLPSKPETQESRVVVVEDSGKTVGLIVDGMREVIRIPVSAIHTPPAGEADGPSLYIQGVAKMDHRLLVILDLGQLLGANALEGIS